MANIFRILFVVLLLCGNAHASGPVSVDAPGDPLVEVVISDSARFMKEWVSRPTSLSPEMKRVSEVKFNQRVHAGIVVSGFSMDSSSNVDFVISVEVTDPNGAVILKDDAFAVHQGQFTGRLAVIMSSKVLDMEFDPRDPAGVYEITAAITDNIANTRATGSTRLTLTP